MGVIACGWYGTWITVATNLSCVACKGNVHAYAIGACRNRFVHIFFSHIPIPLWYHFGIVCPHLGDGVYGALDTGIGVLDVGNWCGDVV